MVEIKSRIERAVLNMSIAFLISKRGTCARAQVGAVITRNNRIISTGYNGALHKNEDYKCGIDCDPSQRCTNSVHAELNAIAAAAKEGISLDGAILYCTHQPCLDCAKAIIQSGITKVVYCHPYWNPGVQLLKDFNIQISQVDYESVKSYIKA